MPKSIAYTERDKGSSMLVAGGKYEGREGWIHSGCKQPKKMIHVLLKATRTDAEMCCCIHRDSVREVHFEDEPRSFTDAMLKEHKDMAVDMQKLAEKLAEVDGLFPNTEVLGVFWKMWADAKEKQAQENVRSIRFVTSWRGTPNNAGTQTSEPDDQTQTSATRQNDQRGSRPHLIPDGWGRDDEFDIMQ